MSRFHETARSSICFIMYPQNCISVLDKCIVDSLFAGMCPNTCLLYIAVMALYAAPAFIISMHASICAVCVCASVHVSVMCVCVCVYMSMHASICIRTSVHSVTRDGRCPRQLRACVIVTEGIQYSSNGPSKHSQHRS